MQTVVSSPGQSEPVTITGRMVFDAEDRTRAVLTMPRPDSGRPVEMEMVSEGTVMYMHSRQFGSLPDGREWMALDLSSFGQEMDSPVPANSDAHGELELLEEVAGDVQELGSEDVRGVSTTRYRGTISPSEGEGSPLEIEAWIDAEGLVRRMRYVRSQPGDGDEGPTTMDMRMDFFDFGIEPEIDVPAASEVFDATALAQEEFEPSNDD